MQGHAGGQRSLVGVLRRIAIQTSISLAQPIEVGESRLGQKIGIILGEISGSAEETVVRKRQDVLVITGVGAAGDGGLDDPAVGSGDLVDLILREADTASITLESGY